MNQEIKREKLNTRQAAEYIKVSEVTMWKLRKEGRIAFYNVRGTYFYDLADLDAYLNSCRIPTQQERLLAKAA